jgi:tripeptide aminopeptidase
MRSMANKPDDVQEISPGLEREIARVLASAHVQSAIEGFRGQESQLRNWQMDMARIPAPPFGEAERSQWLAGRFRELDLEDVHEDSVGNVLGLRKGSSDQCVAVSAHIDTVFPAGTPLNIRQDGSRLYGPGISDNGAGATALLGIAAALKSAHISHDLSVLFIGNVGEEGEGDLRGMRHIFSNPELKDSITYSLVLDGAGSDTIVAEALGSRRFEVIVRGPGGHSWSDYGTANPIPVLARAIHAFTQTSVPASPKTTFNIGVIQGGTSVNSIPESASMRVDIRSASTIEIEKLEAALRNSISSAAEEELRMLGKRGPERKGPPGLSFEVIGIGDRPAGELNPNARILEVIRAVDAHLENVSAIQRASTDANIPLSQGREAISIGGGGTGGGAHTLQEWFDCDGRDLGLTRILATLLVLAGMLN